METNKDDCTCSATNTAENHCDKEKENVIERKISIHDTSSSCIIIANTSEELDEVFKLRYKVYVEEEKKFGTIHFADKKMHDEYDDKINTINLLMLEDGEAIGTVRVTGSLNSHNQLPSDKLYNFDQVRENHPGLIPGNIGMLAIKKSHQNTRTFNALTLSLGKVLLKQRYDYYMFTLNHECSNLFYRVVGAKKLSEKIWSAEICNYFIPMILYREQALSFVQKMTIKDRN